MKSSPHGPYKLGYIMYYNDFFKQLCNRVIYSKFLKIIVFGLMTAIRHYKGGITSNRRSASYGEFVIRPCTHRPSHAGSGFCLKDFQNYFYLFFLSSL